MSHWTRDAVFYHVYPLGLCGAPRQNGLSGTPQHRMEKLLPWLDHARELGATALLLGPVMESGSHGYDVADYFQVDRRLGEQSTMSRIAAEAGARGMRVVLDAVFHHVGRDFWAFRDVREKGQDSRFVDWFHLDFKGRSPFQDPFSYQTWNGCHDLVKLNLGNPAVRDHLFEAAAAWVRDYHIDGLRLDAADHLDMGFMRDLGTWCRGLKPDFWLMGEVVRGPYSRWLEDAGLDSVTNYEGYKALYSSHNDENYHEIAYTLRRQFGESGLYGSAALYTFVDNHDVARVATRLKDPAHLYPLYCLLFTVPGIPSIYYGSEFGLKAAKGKRDDWPLRPALDLNQLRQNRRSFDLVRTIARLTRLRAQLSALRGGDFQEVFLGHRRIVFSRRTAGQWVIVAVSAEKEPVDQEVILPEPVNGILVDLLNPGQQFEIKDGKAKLAPLWPCWARVMEVRKEIDAPFP
jgi:cyclomaltodextrinase